MTGGFLSHPAEAFPSVFGHAFWKENPYFLPCGAAALFSLVCFLVALVFLQEVRADNAAKHILTSK